MVAAVRLTFAVALIVVPLWLSHAAPARACIVAPSDSPDPLGDNVAKTGLIAIGTIGEMLILPAGSLQHAETLGGQLPLEIKFPVSEYLKGSGESTLLLYRPTYQVVTENSQIVRVLPSSDCDHFTPTLGTQYLLFLQKADPLRYQAGIAVPITPDSDAPAFIAEVRAAIVRRAGLPGAGSAPAESPSAPIVPLLAAGAMGVALASTLLFATRRAE